MIWATISFEFVLADCKELLHLWLQTIQSIWFRYWPSGDVHVWSWLLCCWKRAFAMTSVFSWQYSASLCPASFCTPSQTCLLFQVSLEFLHLHSKTLWGKGHFFVVLFLEDFVGLHRTRQCQFLQHQWLGHRFGLLWCWIVCLGNKPRSFCHFWGCTQVLHFRLSCWIWGLLHFF